MYQDHFGLHADPFALSPSLRFLYRSQAHAETMAHLGYGLEQGEDIIMISGAIGTGKTLALQNLQAKVSKIFSQVLVNVTRVRYIEFLKLVLNEMGGTWVPGADVADLLVALKDRARAVNEKGRKVLLVVDEAQNLDVETLEGVRLLTNLGQPDKQFFQIVLAGQPALEELVNRPELAQLRQRIRVHYRLEPLSAKETAEYIHHRTSVAGAMRPLFTAQAVRRIHDLSRGIPRLVNHLASHAMLAAFVERDREVDARHVAAEGLPETPEPVEVARTETRPKPSPTPAGPAIAEPDDDEPSAEAPRRTVRDERSSGRRRAGLWWAWGALIVAVLAVGWYLLGRDTVALPWLTDRGPTTETMNPTMDAAQPMNQTPGDTESPVEAGSDSDAGNGSDAGMGPTTEPAADVAVEPADEPRGTVTPVTPIERQPIVAQAQRWLHVASFRDRQRAERFVALLDGTGVTVETRSVTLDDGNAWLRILVGPITDQAAGEALAEDLRSRGLITFHRQITE
jgi:general secretion pathway protein A